MDNLIKIATMGVLAASGYVTSDVSASNSGSEGNFQPPPKIDELTLEQTTAIPGVDLLTKCPAPPLPEYHQENHCEMNAARLTVHHQAERGAIFDGLVAGGTGATLVPNQQTVYCPHDIQQLEKSSAVKGFDTKWIVENTATTPVVLSWVVNGKEYSPFHPDISPPQDDPDAILQPNEWKAVPAFESYVYYVRELTKDNRPGQVLLQHRAGLVPIGNPNSIACDATQLDVEPINLKTAERQAPYRRTPTHEFRRCNTLDVGFRNQVGCPLHVYWAGIVTPEQVPSNGFSCGEKFKFHLGTKPATQDFMHDWESATKFEGSFIGHTFVARLASDPTIVVDSYTLMPTKIVDCPTQNPQLTAIGGDLKDGEVMAKGNQMHIDEGVVSDAATLASSIIMADMATLEAVQPIPDIAIDSNIGAGLSRGGEL